MWLSPTFTHEATVKSALEAEIQSTSTNAKGMTPSTQSYCLWDDPHSRGLFSPSKLCPLPTCMGVGGGNKGGDEGLYLNHRLYWQLCLCVHGISSRYTGDQVTVVTVQEQEGGTLCLLGRHVSNTILGTGYTSVDKTDTIHTPLNCFNLSMHIFPFQIKNNHLNNIEGGKSHSYHRILYTYSKRWKEHQDIFFM